jgi:hypothetical protein
MNPEPYVNRVLDDEGLVGNLEGDAAEKLVAWLVQSAERVARHAADDSAARAAVEKICERGRAIAAEAATKPNPAEALAALLAKE